MIKGMVIHKSKLGKKVGCILDDKTNINEYKNIIISYMWNSPILICTNLTQEQWDLFCDGKLSKQELDQYI